MDGMDGRMLTMRAEKMFVLRRKQNGWIDEY
jgi:hypothetical protein